MSAECGGKATAAVYARLPETAGVPPTEATGTVERREQVDHSKPRNPLADVRSETSTC